MFQPQTTPGPKSTASMPNTDPAPISISPTSTINPQRPRTVAAGYQLNSGSGQIRQTDTGTLTVVFRDGTFYNYYDVPSNVWTAFKGATSKGQFIRTYIDGTYSHGYANQPAQSPSVHKAARVAQQTMRGKQVQKQRARRTRRK